jgi:hypothetical protein
VCRGSRQLPRHLLLHVRRLRGRRRSSRARRLPQRLELLRVRAQRGARVAQAAAVRGQRVRGVLGRRLERRDAAGVAGRRRSVLLDRRRHLGQPRRRCLSRLCARLQLHLVLCEHRTRGHGLLLQLHQQLRVLLHPLARGLCCCLERVDPLRQRCQCCSQLAALCLGPGGGRGLRIVQRMQPGLRLGLQRRQGARLLLHCERRGRLRAGHRVLQAVHRRRHLRGLRMQLLLHVLRLLLQLRQQAAGQRGVLLGGGAAGHQLRRLLLQLLYRRLRLVRKG